MGFLVLGKGAQRPPHKGKWDVEREAKEMCGVNARVSSEHPEDPICQRPPALQGPTVTQQESYPGGTCGAPPQGTPLLAGLWDGS